MDGFFLQGSLYDEQKTTGAPRAVCCSTCAFRAGPGTVRPDGVEPADVFAQTDTCDDFICHTPDEDGSHPSCPGWRAWMSSSKIPLDSEAPVG